MTTPACDAAPHPIPAHTGQVLPPVPSDENMSKALGAMWAGCEQCIQRHRELVAEEGGTPLVMRAVMLGLIMSAIHAHELGLTPPDNAAELLFKLHPSLQPHLATVTEILLSNTPIERKNVAQVGGAPLAHFRDVQLLDAIGALSGEGRTAVWTDFMTFLYGALRGVARAMEEREGRL